MAFKDIPNKFFFYKEPVLVEIIKQLAENDWALHAEGDFLPNRLLGDILKTIICEKVIERIKLDKLAFPIWDCDSGFYIGTGEETFQEIDLPEKTFEPSFVFCIAGFRQDEVFLIFHGEDSMTSSIGFEPLPGLSEKIIDSYRFREGTEEIGAFRIHWGHGRLTRSGFKVTGDLNIYGNPYSWIAFGNV
jgi:hypothetical protein